MLIAMILFGAAIAVLSVLVGVLIVALRENVKVINNHEANLRMLKAWAEQKDMHVTALMMYIKAADSRNAANAPIFYQQKQERLRELLAIAEGFTHENVNPLRQFGVWL